MPGEMGARLRYRAVIKRVTEESRDVEEPQQRPSSAVALSPPMDSLTVRIYPFTLVATHRRTSCFDVPVGSCIAASPGNGPVLDECYDR